MTQLSPWFDGEVREVKLSLYHKDKFTSYLHSLKGPVQLKVEKLTRHRSTNQNSYYWGVVLKLIADHTGAEPEEIHDALKFQFTQKRFVGNLVAPASTKRLDTVDFEAYLDKVRRWAQEELNVTIPLPGEVDVS